MTRRQDADPAAELRELIREAHGAVRDLAPLLREYRQAAAEGAEAGRKAAYDAALAEMNRWGDHFQAELNRHAADLNEGVRRAQAHIVDMMSSAGLTVKEDGSGMIVQFHGGSFKEDPDPAAYRKR